MGGKRGTGRRDELVAAIGEELGLIRPDTARIAADCALLQALLGRRPDRAGQTLLRRLAAAAAAADHAAAAPVLRLLAACAAGCDRPLPLLQPLLAAEDDAVAAAGMDLLREAVAAGRLPLDRRLLAALAARLVGGASDGTAQAEPLPEAAVRLLAAVPDGRRGLERILAGDRDPRLRALAARLLDQGGGPAPAALARTLLGAEAHAFLAPYLDYTRAGCADLLALLGGRRLDPAVVPSLRQAQDRWGAPLVRQLVAELGWERINRGLEVRRRVEVTVPGLVPAFLPPDQAALLARAGGVPPGPARLLVVARGAAAVPGGGASRAKDPVDRFRRLNTVHAELLAEILDVAPLLPPKVERILAAMDAVVADYVALFAGASDECAVLPAIWAELAGRVRAALDAGRDGRPLTAELTRLVQTFEDPPNVGAVRTVHGLKRYLHQKGLKLGFALVDTAQAPNRTVDLVLVDRRGRLRRAPTIRYAEFEAAAGLDEPDGIPHPVRLVVEGWARALLAGRQAFPDVNVFLFGNEVQYYAFFRNHPVFLRIDFSPPRRGGMIDLEYYGVSGYELDVHPNPQLDAIRRFFRDLDFDVSLEGVRLHARYDKERCPDLGDLDAKAAALLRLVPWLMELDWLIGSLHLTGEGRRLLAEAWSCRFRDSGMLPERDLLTADRRGVLRAVEPGPTGPVERRWDGAEPYADRFTGPVPTGLLPALRAELARLLLDPPTDAPPAGAAPGLLHLEAGWLEPVARAKRRGRLVRRADGSLAPADPELVQPLHEAERFAELLAAGGPAAAAAVGLARPVAELERFVEFVPTGSVGGLHTERAVLPVRGGRLTVFALRDGHGLVRMGLVCAGLRLLRRRGRRGAAWRTDGGIDAARLWSLLRGANYVAGAACPPAGDPAAALAELRTLAAADRAEPAWRPAGSDKVLCGQKAAPGRAVGRARFGTAGRRPEDLAGQVLVAREIRPADNPFLFRTAGVVCTGGAVLSHAALLAIQFGKPALLVDARWDEGSGRAQALRFTTTVHRDLLRVVRGFDVRVRVVVERRADRLQEGDLVVLDADEAVVRVLGQDRDALGLWEGLCQLGEAARQAATAGRDQEVMAARALHLRARHQVQKILDRLGDEALAGFAVEEIVAGTSLGALAGGERRDLLARLLANGAVRAAARARLADVAARLAGRAAAAARVARAGIPPAGLVAEILGLRLRALRAHELHQACADLLAACGLEASRQPPPADLDALARRRLQALCRTGRRDLASLAGGDVPAARARHLVRQLERCGRALGRDTSDLAPWCRRLETADTAARRRHAQKLVLPAAACGFALQPLVGWKAANLGEMAQLAGGEPCPPWFVVTDAALGAMLDQPGPEGTLRGAIAGLLARPDLDHQRQAAVIRDLWRRTPLPDALVAAVAGAYRGLADPDGAMARVAIRSSSCDEDSEAAMRAGVFETSLNVHGEGALLDHLRLCWAGLWSERALHGRAVDPAAAAWPRGGLIVQRMADARVSGVVQTVNVARGDLGELVVNAGLGLGEGIVSGVAAADLVTVLKPAAGGAADDALRFTYLVADKPVQVVRDERRGTGTRLAETLYHQRLRPALEYVELEELVGRCLRLERAYGYPLDLEFAVQDQRLWLLQARPIGTFWGEFNESLARHPLAAARRGGRRPRPGVTS
ncbi:MAG: PEP/pyruvate-binding domain-containing protein [Candidatus Krumholzibacteriia bacterium]